MQFGNVPGLDRPVSRLAQGTMMLKADDEDWTFRLLDAVFELGCNTFDLAHIYAGGNAERLLGRWMAARGVRDRINLLTKGCHQNSDRKRVTEFDLAADLHDSLARLQVQTIDLYVLHRDDPDVEVGRIVDWLNEHADAGRIRAFGGSNWTHERLAAATEYAEANGLIPFVLSSPHYSLADMVEPAWDGCVAISGPAGEAARRWYAERDMPVFAWSSLARGFFTGLVRRDNLESLEETNRSSLHAFCHEPNFQRLDRVETLAREKGATVPQIAMAYVANTPLNLFALVGCCSGEEFRECAEAWDISLTPEEMDWLDLQRDDR